MEGYYSPLLYAGEDGVLMTRYQEIDGTIITKPVSFPQGNPRFPNGTIGQTPGHIVDNTGQVWQFYEHNYNGQYGVLVAEQLDTIGENGSFQPGLSGNDCATGVMITDTDGGLWSNIGPSENRDALRRIMEDNKTGEAFIDTDYVQTSAKLTQLRTMPNLIAEGTQFDIGDDHGHIYTFWHGISFNGGYGTVPEMTRDGGTPVIFDGDHSDTGQFGNPPNAVLIDGSGSLTLSENGMKVTVKGLQPWQYLRDNTISASLLYGTENGSYYISLMNPAYGKGQLIKGKTTPGRILLVEERFHLRTDGLGDLYGKKHTTDTQYDVSIASPVRFLPDSTEPGEPSTGHYVYAIGVDHHVYAITETDEEKGKFSVSDTGITVDPSLHAGISGQTGPVVKYTLSDNVAADPTDAASNVTVTSPSGATVPSGWSAAFTGQNVTVTFPTDWTIPDGATYDVNVKVKPTRTGRVLAASDGTLTWKTGSATYDDLYVTGAAPLAASMPATGIPQSDAIRFAGITAGLGCVTVSLRRRRMKA